jgi:alcohol dehydrogenase (cytochrome c)
VAQEGCGINTKAADKFRPGGNPFMATGYVESPQEPWEIHVRALELATGKLRWDYKQIGSRRYGAGLLSTAGGLVFAGDDQGTLTALDAATGKALWRFNTGQRISASPMAYRFKDLILPSRRVNIQIRGALGILLGCFRRRHVH